ncbi:putative 2EXR domain-containing protein [Seiridium cardinale]|uniref:2EXR domain-containing protein n=1 Tax=Seiridium cardinale TaxID=138064 RepID=A0ABR2XH96_9PEZI
MEPNDSESASCGKRSFKEESFAKFPDLPKELRLQIWENCLEAESQYRIVISGTMFSDLIFPTRHLACALLSVNHEARQCALAHFTTAVTVYHSRNSLRRGHRKAEPGELLAAGRVHLRLEDDYFIPRISPYALRLNGEVFWDEATGPGNLLYGFVGFLASNKTQAIRNGLVPYRQGYMDHLHPAREKLLESNPCKLSFILSKEDSLKATTTTGLIDPAAIKPGWS